MVWSHTPRLPVLLWTAFTFPFTIWDTLYIALRPHTLPGHKWHDPIWTQVGTYAAVDGVYGEQAWLEGEGWTAAQGVVNVTEVVLYLWYYAIVRKSRKEGKGVSGKMGGKACVVGLVAGTVTLTKSMLYLMREAFSGFKYVGKADVYALLTTWVLMK
ncbi:hypothetical protein M7I_7545 [Glarea lozoyensis 74030]|uniref:Uncharacterized protein n=1 Tax=Glarea lozoyensis (strain ATCC 74030 / MF5533) TaxID=1104152 RepID=H0EXK8_GLAL7|nr:hypothetical protein M7I_7545 [Glarea lozoyensis 74030]